MTSIARALAGALAISALVASFCADAQFPGGFGGGAGGGRAGRGGSSSHSGNSDASKAQPPLTLFDIVQKRLDDLEADLKLTAEQRPAWVAYSDKVQGLLMDVSRPEDDARFREMTAPQRLEHVADIARNRSTAVDDVVEAGKALYALLTPEQQKVADAKLALAVLPMLGSGDGVRVAERRGGSFQR